MAQVIILSLGTKVSKDLRALIYCLERLTNTSKEWSISMDPGGASHNYSAILWSLLAAGSILENFRK